MMPFVESILQHKSISVIGMEKNCGKTVVLNYILSRLVDSNKCVAVTSIGVDGEKIDAVTRTAKPEITLYKGMFFATSEMHYASRRLTSEIIDIGQDSTSLGRVILARVIESGKAMLSGPGDTPSLKRLIDRFQSLGCDMVIVDGALSRKSLASPSVTDAMVLCTGAALSLNIDELTAQTKHTYNMITLPVFETKESEKELMQSKTKGLWAVTNNELIDLDIHSSIGLEKHRDSLFKAGHTLYFSGMLTDKALEVIMINNDDKGTEIIVKDFTKLFITAPIYRKFIAWGGEIKVLTKSKLEAICINPLSPTGYSLNAEKLAERLQTEIGIAAYDVLKI